MSLTKEQIFEALGLEDVNSGSWRSGAGWSDATDGGLGAGV